MFSKTTFGKIRPLTFHSRLSNSECQILSGSSRAKLARFMDFGGPGSPTRILSKEKRERGRMKQALHYMQSKNRRLVHPRSPILKFLSKIRCFRTFLRTPTFFWISRYLGKIRRFCDLRAAIFRMKISKVFPIRIVLSLHALGGAAYNHVPRPSEPTRTPLPPP